MESIVPVFAYSVVWWSIYQQNLTPATFMTSLKNNWYTIVLFVPMLNIDMMLK